MYGILFRVEDTIVKPPRFKMTVTQSKLTFELGRRLGYQGPRKGASSRSIPCDKSARTGKFNLLQINIEGLQHKVTELLNTLSTYNIHIALIQETILPKHEIKTPGYTKKKCECMNCRGIMTLIRNDIQAEVKNCPFGDVDTQEIDVWIDKEHYKIHHIYCPPNSKSQIPVHETNFKKTIIAGDFNAHLPSLGYSDYNSRGKDIEEILNSTNLILKQDMNSEPTLRHKRHGTNHRPDLTFISADVDNRTTVRVLDDIGSDHKPILTTLTCKQKPKRSKKTFWNFKKANWNKYAMDTDTGFEKIDVQKQPVDKVVTEMTEVIREAVKANVPRGNHKKYKPFWNRNLDEAVKERKKSRKTVELQNTTENRTTYNKLTARVRCLTRTSKREHWRKTCQNLDLKKDGRKAWKLLKNLEGSKRKENPKPISHNGKKVSDAKKKANIFNNYMSSVSKSSRRRNLDKSLWKQFKTTQNSPSCNNLPFEQNFSTQELETAIKKAHKRKSPGPDQITNEMICNLGSKAKSQFLDLVNKSWQEGQIPSQWRTANITPILKKGKPAGLPSSYRPISLTSCLGKIAERMVNNRLYHWLEQNKLLSSMQAGFRKGSRTEDQLFRFVQNVMDGFQNKKNTTAVFIDLQQAYDRVWRKGLLMKMSKIGIHGKMLKWIQAFLSNRTIQTSIDGAISSKKTLEEGLPQGSALSCTLFLIFINDLPELLKIEKALFADDLVLWTTDKYEILARAKLNRALGILTTYCSFWKLKINLQKSAYTIFSMSHKSAKKTLSLKLDGSILLKEENPQYLGVQLDRQLSMTKFMNNLKEKASKRLNLIKHLASTTWGAGKRTLRQLYLGYVRSAIDYALPLQEIATRQAKEPIDRVQNQAVKLICGGMRSTPIAACEIDANIEPLDLRRKRSVLQGVERYRRFEENHPNRTLVDSWVPNRRLKQESLLDTAAKLEDIHHLPTNRLQEKKISEIAPWTKLETPIIKTSLLDPSLNKSTDPNVLKLNSLETIDSYPTTSIHAYTDGSAFKGTTFAGFGVYLKFPEENHFEFNDACGAFCSNFEAEISAIKAAVEITHQSFELNERPPSNIVIFTDSKSTLQALAETTSNSDQNIISLAKTIDNFLTSYDVKLTLQWIPGHSGIQGNETADRLAKLGTQKEHPDKPCSILTTNQILKNNFKEEWLNRWSVGTTGRAMYNHMTKPIKDDPINNLSRPDQCNIFQFRTGHCKLNSHINRLNPFHPPQCRRCIHPYETVHHVLFDCQAMKEARKDLLPPVPSINNTLYGSAKQLQKTSYFIKKFLPLPPSAV